MRTAISPRCIAVVCAAVITVGISFSTATADVLEGCSGQGVGVPSLEGHLPNLLGGYLIVSDEQRTAEQLAATFADPADALARLHAWCWYGQSERVYFNDQDDRTIDVSIHTFIGSEAASQAQRWFADQRAQDLGLQGDIQTRAQLEEELLADDLGAVNIEALDNIGIIASSNDSEHTLYAQRDNADVRVTVSGEPSVYGWSREAMAYRVLAQVFGVDLFPPPCCA